MHMLKFCFKLKKTAPEMHKTALSNKAMGKIQICTWFPQLQNRETSAEDC